MRVAAPTTPPQRDALELLIREARARQRKRWLGLAAGIALLAGAALAAFSVVGGWRARTQNEGAPRSRPAALLPRCRSDQLHLSSSFYNAAAGSVTTAFTFTNVSVSSCTLRGWPGLRLVLPGGRVVVPHARQVRLTAESMPLRVFTVRLRPRGAASFDVTGINQVGRRGPLDRRCSAGARAVYVTPPGAQSPLRVTQALTYCGAGSLSVYPVAPGRVDRQWGK
jgi:hypothetical protein